MDNVKYEALLTIAETGNITRAADELGYTQSGVTQMVNSLEKELGLKLLFRSNKGVSLTREGEKLLPLIREELHWEERIRQEAAMMQGLESGRIIVGCYESIASKWMPNILARFVEEHPGIEIRLVEGEKNDLAANLRDGLLDIAFFKIEDKDDFDTDILMKDDYLALLPECNPLTEQETVTIEDMANYPLITFRSLHGNESEVLDVLHVNKDIKWNRIYSTTHNNLTIANMVRNGLGVAVVTDMMLVDDLRGLSVKMIEPRMHRMLGINCRCFSELSPAAWEFVKCTKRVMNICS